MSDKLDALANEKQTGHLQIADLHFHVQDKPTKLSIYEFEIIKGHAQAGYEILKGLRFGALPLPVAEIVGQHHERMNGSGYPQGFKGDQIRPRSKNTGRCRRA